MTQPEQKFSQYLGKKQMKFTRERRAILVEIFSVHKHFDVEWIFARLRRKGREISRATIYRTLPLLQESGLIREALRCEDKVTYEHIFGHEHHDHLVCIKCGKIIEFRNDQIEKLQDLVCKKHGFKPLEHRLGIRGYCKECQMKPQFMERKRT